MVKKVDTSEYKQLPTKRWNEIASEKHNVGVISVFPNRLMLSKKGMISRTFNHREKTYTDVIYDRSYALDWFHKRLLLGMDFVIDDVIDDTGLASFLGDLKGYHKKAVISRDENKIREDAMALARKYPVNSAAEWERILRDKITDPELDEEDENQHGHEREVDPNEGL